jgi:transposase
MPASTDAFLQWLTQAQICERSLTAQQRAVLLAAFCFRQTQGSDYYSNRLLSHFLLHCHVGLKVAQVSRLVGVSRPTASRQQGLSSKETIQQAHHRMDGRPYGKLLPRYAGPIAQFVCARPEATRADLIDFIDQTFGVRVSRIALYKFLKKYGLDRVSAAHRVETATPPALPAAPAAALPALLPAPPFCSGTRSTPAPSS